MKLPHDEITTMKLPRDEITHAEITTMKLPPMELPHDEITHDEITTMKLPRWNYPWILYPFEKKQVSFFVTTSHLAEIYGWSKFINRFFLTLPVRKLSGLAKRSLPS